MKEDELQEEKNEDFYPYETGRNGTLFHIFAVVTNDHALALQKCRLFLT